MGIKFDLAGHVEDDEVLFCNGVEGLFEEGEVLHEELEAVNQAAVGPELELVHDIFDGDEVADVEVWGVLEGLGGGVEIDVEARAAV